MPFIIDGHNLIGVLSDIDLADPDDEEQLLMQLQSHASHLQKNMHVYFDRRAPGLQATLRRGRVTAHFVQRGRTADDAIKAHIRRLGRRSSNWTIVSSDQDILRFARHHQARAMTSQAFNTELNATPFHVESDERSDIHLSPEDIKAWEALFREDDSTSP